MGWIRVIKHKFVWELVLYDGLYGDVEMISFLTMHTMLIFYRSYASLPTGSTSGLSWSQRRNVRVSTLYAPDWRRSLWISIPVVHGDCLGGLQKLKKTDCREVLAVLVFFQIVISLFSELCFEM